MEVRKMTPDGQENCPDNRCHSLRHGQNYDIEQYTKFLEDFPEALKKLMKTRGNVNVEELRKRQKRIERRRMKLLKDLLNNVLTLVRLLRARSQRR